MSYRASRKDSVSTVPLSRALLNEYRVVRSGADRTDAPVSSGVSDAQPNDDSSRVWELQWRQ